MSTNLIQVEQVEDKHVNLIVIYNALNMQDRQVAKLNYDPSKTLANYMEGLPDPEMWSVSVNAEPYAYEDWGLVHPAANDFVTVIPIPYGGGDSKGILRVVAMIAVAVVAPYAAGAMMGVSAAAVGATAGGMALTAGITIAGGMLVNALLPPAKPSMSNVKDTSESPTYGIDGAKNTQTEESIVPLIYGEFRYAGNYVNIKTENSGNTQIVYAQAVVSEGEIESITDFEVQEQPLSNFSDVAVVTRNGTATQSVVGWFASSVRMINKSITLSQDWTYHNTAGEVDGFRVDVLLPSGLSNIDDKNGKRKDRSVRFEIQYQRAGSTSWTNLFVNTYRPLETTTIPSGSDSLRVEYQQRFSGTVNRKVTGKLYVRKAGTSDWRLMETQERTVTMHSGTGFLSGAFTIALPSSLTTSTMQYKIDWTQASPTVLASARYMVSPTITARTAKPLRRSFPSGVLPEGEYRIRLRRTNKEAESDYAYDKVTLTDIAEIINERVRYNYTAYYGIRVRLTDQLNGLPQMTAKVKGIKVPHYDRSGKLLRRAWSPNPAWIVMDMLTNRRYGAGMPLSRIDVPMFVEWAEFCDKEKLTFNGVFDSFSNIWDSCQTVLKVGHARFAAIGNVISLSIYRRSEPVMMFGTGNIIEGSLNLSWQSLEDRSNEFEIEYFDRNNGNKQATVRVVNEDAIARGELQRISTTRMVGVDNQRQALFEAHFQKALNEHLVMSGSFETTIEALACSVGDVVLIQHDMPDWGESGRIKPGSTRTSIVVDRPLTIGTSPTTYSMLLLHPVIKRAEGKVSIITANASTVYLSGFSATVKAKRAKYGNRDVLIRNIAYTGGYLELVLESLTGLSVGNTVELWDTDVIETRSIKAYDPDTDTVTLAGPLSADPQDFANYMVGRSNAEAKPVSIVSIDGDGEYKRTISFIEYNATVFDPANAQETPLYTDPVGKVEHVRDLRVEEELTSRSGSIVTDIIIMWNVPADGNYAGAKVYMSRDDGPMERIGTASAGATSFSTTATIGEMLTVKVVGYDGAGRSANYDTAPVWMHSVLGAMAPPQKVENFKVVKGIGGIEFSWAVSKEIDVTSYEIREGPYWSSGVPLIENFSGNRFFTTQKTGGVYTYHIKAKDMLGNVSEEPASAILSLPAPSIVMGFSSVQNGDNAILEWRRNPEIDISGYEIRSGPTWANSQHVVFVSGTSWSIPVGATAIDSYLIKAYDTAGVESPLATRVNQAVYRSQSYNAVHLVEATNEGYLGAMMGFIKVADKLEGEDPTETSYAEYVQPIEMDQRFKAMVTTSELLVGKATEAHTWADMRFTWASSKANVPWFPTTEADDISLTKQISLFVGRRDNDVVAWSLNDTSGGLVYGAGNIVLKNATTTPHGRFGKGLLVNPASTLEVSFSEGNLVTWWMRPAMQRVVDVCHIKGTLGTVEVWIDRAEELVMTDGVDTIRVPMTFRFRDGWSYFVGVSNAEGKVRMYIRCLQDASDMLIDLDANIGALSGIRLV